MALPLNPERAPEGERVELEGEAYLTGRAYYAASGRACRALVPEVGVSPELLACQQQDGWVVVPEVEPAPLRPREAQ